MTLFYSDNVPAQPLIAKHQILGAQAGAYLATAGEGLVPKRAIDATAQYYRHKVSATDGRRRINDVTQDVRERLARLLGAGSADIGLLSNTSHALTAVFRLINWREDDNIVLLTNELEFPSLVLPPVKLVRDRGVEMRVVDHDNWEVTPESIAAAVDERTRLVLLSHVSYRTGLRIDIERLSELLEGSGAWLVVDASQSLGMVPVPASACHFLVSTSCKWLMGPHGTGVLYWNRDRLPDIVPEDIG
ncbi:MAG: aminotransferase class V-fold PLP-dependent enzyme, partial [Chloroflexota bacterium]